MLEKLMNYIRRVLAPLLVSSMVLGGCNYASGLKNNAESRWNCLMHPTAVTETTEIPKASVDAVIDLSKYPAFNIDATIANLFGTTVTSETECRERRRRENVSLEQEVAMMSQGLLFSEASVPYSGPNISLIDAVFDFARSGANDKMCTQRVSLSDGYKKLKSGLHSNRACKNSRCQSLDKEVQSVPYDSSVSNDEQSLSSSVHVQRGNTLWGIAKAYYGAKNIIKGIGTIISANKAKYSRIATSNGDFIREGWDLTIPANVDGDVVYSPTRVVARNTGSTVVASRRVSANLSPRFVDDNRALANDLGQMAENANISPYMESDSEIEDNDFEFASSVQDQSFDNAPVRPVVWPDQRAAQKRNPTTRWLYKLLFEDNSSMVSQDVYFSNGAAYTMFKGNVYELNNHGRYIPAGLTVEQFNKLIISPGITHTRTTTQESQFDVDSEPVREPVRLPPTSELSTSQRPSKLESSVGTQSFSGVQPISALSNEGYANPATSANNLYESIKGKEAKTDYINMRAAQVQYLRSQNYSINEISDIIAERCGKKFCKSTIYRDLHRDSAYTIA
jgi:hypothetical protein